MIRYLTHIRDWYRDPFRNRPNWSEKTMLLVTIGIALVYAGQYQQMKNSSQQTIDLIKAANIQACAARRIADASQRNAAAAESFSSSAGIQATAAQNAAQAMANQVTKLQAGVEQTAKLVQASEIANSNSTQATEAQTRPWIGIEGDPGISVVLKNFGHSPAIKVFVNFRHDALYTPISPKLCEDADKRLDASLDPTRKEFPSRDFAIFPGATHTETPLIHDGDAVIGCIAYTGMTAGIPPYHTIIVYRPQNCITSPNDCHSNILDYEAR
jgi:hypothetical protein